MICTRKSKSSVIPDKLYVIMIVNSKREHAPMTCFPRDVCKCLENQKHINTEMEHSDWFSSEVVI